MINYLTNTINHPLCPQFVSALKKCIVPEFPENQKSLTEAGWFGMLIVATDV